MGILMEILRAYWLETRRGILMVKCLAMMKSSNWDLLMLN